MDIQVAEVFDEAHKFSANLRLLVVDDNLCSLKVVEIVLRKFKYNVTTTTRPWEALKMLREDKSVFDIIIIDVSMSEIDGFKLLKKAGIEMGIPVMVLSAHSENKYIMKGAQMSRLHNILRHVFKQKHMGQKDEINSNNKKISNQVDEPKTCNDSKASQKRKDRNEEDPATTTLKKQRVVWSPELHEKFLAAVNYLTIEKATPKKILELMNVEGLTRGHVGSHLQKYRLYTKRIDAAENNQENSTQMRSMEAFGFQEVQRFSTIPCSSTPSNTLLSRYHYPPEMNVDGIVPPTTFPNDGIGLASSINPEPRNLANQRVLAVNCSQRHIMEEQKTLFGHNPNQFDLLSADEIMDRRIMEIANDPDILNLIPQISDSMISFGQLNAADESMEDVSMSFNLDNLDTYPDGFLPIDLDALEDLPILVDDEHKPIDETTRTDTVFWL